MKTTTEKGKLLIILVFLFCSLSCQQEVNKVQDDNPNEGLTFSDINLTSEKIEDLVILGKVWGFLKYYHPSIAKGKYNWDNELFSILPEIIESKSSKERNRILLKWTKSIGEAKSGDPFMIDSSQIKLTPDLDWIHNVNVLGPKLSKQLNNICNAKREDTHFYVGFEDYGSPIFENEKPYPINVVTKDVGCRLLSLYRYWNMVQYFFPYKNLIGEDWNHVLKEFVPKFIDANTELDYKLTVLSLIACIHDTHANLSDNTLDRHFGTRHAPVAIRNIEGKAVVTDYFNPQLAKISGLKKGDIILTVNNKNVDEIIKSKLPLTPASNYPTQLRSIMRDIARSNDTAVHITYKRNNLTVPLTIKCYSLQEIDFESNYFFKDTCFRLIAPHIAYINTSTLKNSYLPEIMPQVMNTKGLIIDLRFYAIDNITFTLGEYLMPDSCAFYKKSKTSVSNPGLFTYYNGRKIGQKNPDYYKGEIILIVNELTQSGMEFTAMAYRVAPKALVIGSTTAAADGNVSEIMLPGGLRTHFSGIGVYYPDGTETQRIGIVPDVEVKPTIKGITEGRDELIEKAIELINH